MDKKCQDSAPPYHTIELCWNGVYNHKSKTTTEVDLRYTVHKEEGSRRDIKF